MHRHSFLRRRPTAGVRAGHLGAAGATLGVLACSVAHMALPADFAAHTQVLEARDRSRSSGLLADESFALGPYRVSDVDRDWDSTDETTSADVTISKTESGYSYALVAEAVRLEGRCGARSGGSEADLGKGWSLTSGSYSTLECRCGAVASLKLDNDGEAIGGTLTHRGRIYDLRAVTALEGGGEQDQPTGYRVDADAPLAAVEVQHPGRIWMTPQIEEVTRMELTCLFAGLMLYQAPDER
jgi:hypothetical protein